jgi:hypothetical protein
MEKIKPIADRYKIKKTLFKVNNYLYARSNISITQSSTATLLTLFLAVWYLFLITQYVYEN